MNERVKAIVLAALRLSPEERRELVQAVLDNVDLDPADADVVFTDEDASGGAIDEAVARPTSDVLAKYLDT